MSRRLAAAVLSVAAAAVVPSAPAPPPRDDWPMSGGTHSRNMVNRTARGIPDGCDPEKGTGILWQADLGSRAYGGPTVAGGRVYVGTNNQRPRNPRDTKFGRDGEVEPIDRGILMCFDERTGAFLWQSVHDKLANGRVSDWPEEGVCSTPTVEGDRVYYVSNRCEVVCLDANGFADGNQGFRGEKYTGPTDADVLWSFDMIRELGVFPHNMSACPPLVVGDAVFVVTANGLDEDHVNVPAPDAPSFIAIDKHTGKLLWKDNSPGKNVMHGQWGVPSFTADPVPQVIFPGGDGWLRAFDPPTGRLLWKFDANPKDAVYNLGGIGTRSDFVNTAPVVADGRVYIGTGQDPEHSSGVGHFWCLDVRKAVAHAARNPDRDVSPEVIERVVRDGWSYRLVVGKNPDAAVAWHYGGETPRAWASRDFVFGRTMSSACVVGDLVYAAELAGILHCLNARTGEKYWEYDTKAAIWGSPYYGDGKVYLANEQGELFVFRHDRVPRPEDGVGDAQGAVDATDARLLRTKVRKRVEDRYLIRKTEFDHSIRTTPVVANGVLYVMTEQKLYAIGVRP